MLRGRVSQVGIEARTVAEYIRQPFVDGQTRRIARLAQQAADALPAGPSPVATGVIVVDVPKGPANLVVLAEPAGLVPAQGADIPLESEDSVHVRDGE